MYYNSIWLSLSHLVDLWQTKCSIIRRALNICDRANILYKLKCIHIYISFYIYLIAWMLIYDH